MQSNSLSLKATGFRVIGVAVFFAVAQLVIPRLAEAQDYSDAILGDRSGHVELFQKSQPQKTSADDYVAPNNGSPDTLQGSGTR